MVSSSTQPSRLLYVTSLEYGIVTSFKTQPLGHRHAGRLKGIDDVENMLSDESYANTQPEAYFYFLKLKQGCRHSFR